MVIYPANILPLTLLISTSGTALSLDVEPVAKITGSSRSLAYIANILDSTLLTGDHNSPYVEVESVPVTRIRQIPVYDSNTLGTPALISPYPNTNTPPLTSSYFISPSNQIFNTDTQSIFAVIPGIDIHAPGNVVFFVDDTIMSFVDNNYISFVN